MLLFNQRQIMESAKFTYSSLRKAFEKQAKKMELKGKNQLVAITNQNERPEDLANKDDHKSIYKEIFSKLVKKKFVEIKELT